MAYTRDANVPCGLVSQLTGARAYLWNQREEGSDLRASCSEKRAIASATAVISNAQHAAEMLIERFQLNGAKVNLVPNGVISATPVETRKQWRSRLEISEHTFMACIVANYTLRKIMKLYSAHGSLLATICASLVGAEFYSWLVEMAIGRYI